MEGQSMATFDKPTEPVSYGNNTFWGIAGGQLEFVSQRFEMRKRTSGTEMVVILRFTDHDVQANPRNDLIQGKYYEFEFPLSENR